MKKIFNLVVLVLAVNFLCAAGGIGWLFQSGRLDRQRVHAVKEIVFPATQPAAPATQPSEAQTHPSADKQLQDLLARAAGKGTAAEQVEFIRAKYDESMHEMDLRRRELDDLEHQVTEANRKLLEDRKALEAERKQLADRENQADKLANDEGFQEALALVIKMPPKQAKDYLSMLDDSKMADYLKAMEPGQASKITKEFGRSPEDKTKLKRVMDLINSPRPTTAPGSVAASDTKE